MVYASTVQSAIFISYKNYAKSIFIVILYKKEFINYCNIGKKESIFLNQKCYNIDKKIIDI